VKQKERKRSISATLSNFCKADAGVAQKDNLQQKGCLATVPLHTPCKKLGAVTGALMRQIIVTVKKGGGGAAQHIKPSN